MLCSACYAELELLTYVKTGHLLARWGAFGAWQEETIGGSLKLLSCYLDKTKARDARDFPASSSQMPRVKLESLPPPAA